MIRAFPDPYPDEIFYSICARYGERVGYSSNRHLLQDLFGNESAIASVQFPSRIDYLIAHLPPESEYTSEHFITKHTLLPFYAPFLSSRQLHHLRQDICGSNGLATHMRSGIMASHVPLPEFLRLCSKCAEEDKKLFGECYWHRSHQVPGVEICQAHEVYLQTSSVRTRNRKNRHEYIPAERALQNIALPHTDLLLLHHEALLKIAKDAFWLLHQSHLPSDLQALHRKYRRQLANIDLATYRGRVDISMLLQKFRSFHSPQFLELLHCELEERVSEKWLLRLIHAPHGAQHPLYHLLLIHFLGYTVEDFFATTAEDKPFGIGPWPCLNPVCSRYYQSTIEDCHIVYSPYAQGKPIATFSCICGFTYSRTGPDKSANDHFKRSKIKSVGGLWEKELCNLWQDGTISLRGISQSLGVDPITVKRHAARLGLHSRRSAKHLPSRRYKSPITSESPTEKKVIRAEEHRAAWLSMIQNNPEAGIKILRSKVPAVYTWLYRNDYAWLKEHSPRITTNARLPQNRVDWEQRDMHLAKEVEQAALRLKDLSGRPVQITSAALGREVGQSALLEQHQDKLPKTTVLLAKLTETQEAFAVRKILWVAEIYRSQGTYPERWKLIKDAGIERHIDKPLIRNTIDEALRSLQSSLKGTSINGHSVPDNQ